MRLKQAAEVARAAAKNVLLGGNLVSLSLAAHPGRMIQYLSESLFLFKALNAKRGIPQRNVFEVLPSSDAATIALGGLTSAEHWFWPQPSYTADLVSLCLICQLLKPKVVFEIGTLRGYTALHFALNTSDSARVYTLDLPRGSGHQRELYTTLVDDLHIDSDTRTTQYCFQGSAVEDRITCLFGDSASFDYSPFFERVDFFFIDGAHSYEYVRSDTLNALKCCHPGSVIAWHDFGRTGVNGVSEWILELATDHEIFSIPGGSLAFMVVPK